MPKCPVCDNEDFDLQDGLYYCTECCTQSQVIREEGLEDDFVDGVRNVRTIGSAQKQTKHLKDDPGYQWQMVEAYNIILHQQTTALVALGAGPNFEECVLQLWSRYLKECEQAFVSSNQKWTPRFCSRPYHRDLQVACGSVVKYRRLVQLDSKRLTLIGLKQKFRMKKKQIKKKEPKTKNSEKKTKRRKRRKIANEDDVDPPPVAEEESAAPEQEETSQSKVSWRQLLSLKQRFSKVAWKKFKQDGSRPKTMTSNTICVDRVDLLTTVSILCLALRVACPNILLSDVSRWIREGHIPYMHSHKLLPSEWKVYSNDKAYFTSKLPPSVAILQSGLARLSRFLGHVNTHPVDVQYVAARYLTDMNLPHELMSFVNVVIERFIPKPKPPMIQKVEYWAAISILFVLKHLFGLDSKTEKTLSALYQSANVERRNAGVKEYFVWSDWQDQMNHIVQHIRTRQPYSLSFSPEECQDIDIIVDHIQHHILDPCETDIYSTNDLKKVAEGLDSIKRGFARLTRQGKARELDPQEPANSFPIQTILRKCLSRVGLEVVDFTKRKIHPVRSQLYWFCHQVLNTDDVYFPDSFLVPFYVLQEVLDWKLKDVMLDLSNLEHLVFGIKKTSVKRKRRETTTLNKQRE